MNGNVNINNKSSKLEHTQSCTVMAITTAHFIIFTISNHPNSVWLLLLQEVTPSSPVRAQEWSRSLISVEGHWERVRSTGRQEWLLRILVKRMSGMREERGGWREGM